MSFGITSEGFIRKDFNTILSEMQQKAREDASRGGFGSEIDLSIYSVLGILIELMAYNVSLQWEAFEALYYSLFLDSAEGVGVDHIVSLNSLVRKEPLKSEAKLKFTGDAGTLIPKGTQISNQEDTIYFQTLQNAIIESSGVVQIKSECTKTGEIGNVRENTLIKIVNPISNLDSVTNLLPAQNGRARESDNELINRYKQTGGAKGSSLAGITTELENVSGVRSAVAYENNSNETDTNGIPPRAIQVIVDGGDNTAIALAIYKAKGLTTQTYGAISAVVIDESGGDKTIYFSRSERLSVAIKYKLSTNELYKPITIPPLLKAKALEYVKNLLPGEPLQKWKLIAIQDALKGLDNVEVEITHLDNNQRIEGNKLTAQRSEKITTTAMNITVEILP